MTDIAKLDDEKVSELRRRAEEKLLGKTVDIQTLSDEEVLSLVHELEVHQLELEMQNDELRRIQHDLEAALGKYHELFDFAPVAYFTINAEGLILEANLTATELLGTERGSLTDQKMVYFIASENRDAFYLYHRKMLTTTGAETCEVRMVRGDGELFHARIESVRTHDSTDSTATSKSYRAVVSDISESKRAAKALQKERDRAQTYFDLAAVIFVVIDTDQRVSVINRRGCQLLRYKEKDIIGKNWFESFVPENVRAHGKETFQKIINEEIEIPEYVETPVLIRCGEERLIGWHNTVLRDDDGKIRSILGSGEDITERKRLEQIRTRFFAVAGHELRTPLNNLGLSLEVIAQIATEGLSPKLKEMIDITRRSTRRLTRLVNDFLDMQRLEAGELSFHCKPIELMPLVEETIGGARAYSEQLGVRLALVSTLPGAKVWTDTDRLVQVLSNLLSNAVKFSPPGATVEIAVNRYDGQVRTAVTDHGAGIPDHFRQDVFQPFAQAEPSLEDNRRKDSAGLGLSIAKAIIDKLDGRIGFDSKPNVATTFYFDLPEYHDE